MPADRAATLMAAYDETIRERKAPRDFWHHMRGWFRHARCLGSSRSSAKAPVRDDTLAALRTQRAFEIARDTLEVPDGT